MKILLTNDDGIDAPGLRSFRDALSSFGEVVVVAPETEQSAVSHAITMHRPLRVHAGGMGYAVSGTPVDCVKLALTEILDDPPDLVAAGVNLGPNAGVSVFYSGTVSGAFEGAISGIPSIAVSLATFTDPDFGPAAAIGAMLGARLAADPGDHGVVLNVNVPPLPMGELAGIRAVRQARSRFIESYHRRRDPRGRDYFWLDGEMEPLEPDDDTDLAALDRGYVTITPLRPDLTDYDLLDRFDGFDLPPAGDAASPAGEGASPAGDGAPGA